MVKGIEVMINHLVSRHRNDCGHIPSSQRAFSLHRSNILHISPIIFILVWSNQTGPAFGLEVYNPSETHTQVFEPTCTMDIKICHALSCADNNPSRQHMHPLMSRSRTNNTGSLLNPSFSQTKVALNSLAVASLEVLNGIQLDIIIVVGHSGELIMRADCEFCGKTRR